MGIRTVIVLSILAMAFAVVVLFIWLGQRQQQKKLRATARLNRERQQQTRLSKNEPAILQMNNKRVIVDPLVADGDGDDEEQGAYDDNTTSTPHVHVAEPKIVLQENESLQAGEYVSPVRIVSSSTPASAPRSSYSPPKTSSFNTRPFAVPTAAAAANNASTQTEPVIRSQIQTQTYAKYKASTQAQAPTQTQAPSFAGTSTQHQASVQSQTPFLKEPASDYQASSQTQTSPFKETSSQHQASAQAQAPSFAGTSTSSQAASQTQTSSYMGTHSQYQAASQTQSSVHSAAPAQPQFQHHQTTSEPAPKKESASLPGYLTFSLMAEKGKPFGGYELFQAILGSGMRHGERQIFHYYDAQNPNKALFSLASIAKPGTFCIETIGAFSTPGLIFIFEIERTSRLLNAFELLLQTARHLSDELEGNLLDDQRQPLTTERIQSLRQQLCEITPVTDFEDDD